MRYGRFDDRRREYVITRPDTPLPWINYLGCESYLGIISNTAGGYSFYKDARLRRLTRYRYNNVPLDFGGRYLYLRDQESGAFWSPSWMPTRHDGMKDYECRHGLGYTTIGSTFKNVHAQTRYFVPLGENLEIWQVTVTNHRRKPARLSLFSCVEFCLWDAQDDATNFQRNYSIGQVEVVDGVIYHKTEYRERRDHFAYFACSAKLAGHDTQREDFLGPCRGWDRPLVVERGRSANSIAVGWAPMGSHHVKLSLKPGQSREIIFVLGYQENPQGDKFDPPDSQTINKRGCRSTMRRYLDHDHVEQAFVALGERWDRLLGVCTVDTPDIHTNRIVNVWNPYQCMATFNVSRSASLFESGIGRGMGFRDSNQDLLGFVQMVPERARERILDLAATQLPNGGAYHQYQPLTKRGNDDVGSNFNDDPHWLVLAVAAYLKETGDWSILDEDVAFDNVPGSEAPLWEHLQRAIRYTQERLGPHGLPLIGRADWNDCLNLNCFSDTPGQSFQTTTNKEGTTAESVFIAGMFVSSAREMADLAERRGLPGKATAYREAADRMEASVNAHGWDGAWFLRAYDDFGHKVGTHASAEGKIFIEPQGFCVMAGIGMENGRARQAMESVAEHLATPHGIVLHWPAFSRYYLHLGEIGSFIEGYKENGGVFCHNNPWVMIAETRLGNGDRAFDYYKRINPSARESISQIHRCEPYVYAQMVGGKQAVKPGEAKNSWLTGTAAWNYVAITQWILGIRPTHDGLLVAPVIPSDWKGFEVTRVFRGVTYRISAERHGPGNRVKLIVDDRPVAGRTVPIPAGGVTTVRVRAVIE